MNYHRRQDCLSMTALQLPANSLRGLSAAELGRRKQTKYDGGLLDEFETIALPDGGVAAITNFDFMGGIY